MERTDERYRRYVAILEEELVAAMGCTEPIAVALTAAKAAETLGTVPERLCVEVSANLLKNGMGVMVPGTGEMGLNIAAAAGALGGKSALGLECLRDLTPADSARYWRMITIYAHEGDRRHLLDGLLKAGLDPAA